MEYCIRYILTEREIVKLFRLLNLQYQPPEQDSSKVSETRALVRLYALLWLIIKATNRAKLSMFKPSIVANCVCGSILSFRTVGRLIKYTSLPLPALFSPVLGGAIAGYVLAEGLPSELGGPLTVYMASKVGEWLYNWADDREMLDWKPRVLGTWVLFPLAFGQLLHSAFTSPETTPVGFKKLFSRLSYGAFVPRDCDELFTAVHVASQAPRFRSPLIFPSASESLLENLTATLPEIATSRLVIAHPGNTSAVGALLHPQYGSGTEFFKDHVVHNAKLLTRYLLPIYMLKGYVLPSASANSATPMRAIQTACRTIVAYTMTSASAIAGIEIITRVLGKRSNSLRYRLVGVLSGLWCLTNQQSGRAQYLYVVRMALLTLLPRGRKQKQITRVLLPPLLAIAFMVLDVHPLAISQKSLRKAGDWVQNKESDAN